MDNLFLASYSQKNIYLAENMQAGQVYYNVGAAFLISDKINLTKLLKAVKKVVHQNDCFFYQFQKTDKQIQVTKRPVLNLEISYLKWLHLSADEERFPQLLSALKALKYEPYHLVQDQLIRLVVITLAQQKILVVLTHHLILDGFAFGLFVKQLNALLDEQGPVFLPGYDEILRLHRDKKYTSKVLDHCQFYAEKWEAVQPKPISFPLENANHHGHSGECIFYLPDNLYQKIQYFRVLNGASTFNVLLSAFQLLIKLYTNQNTFIIGVPFHGRKNNIERNTLGCFVHTMH